MRRRVHARVLSTKESPMSAGDPNQRTTEVGEIAPSCNVPPPSSDDRPAGTNVSTDARSGFPVCPVCGGELVEIKLKWICSRCHTICETCCEGGPG